MKNKYNQLSSEERDKIAVLRAEGKKLSEIAEAICRHKSTVFRELERNRAPTYNVYLPHKADERARERKQLSGKRPRLKDPVIKAYVLCKLKDGWSPEQIAGRMPIECPGFSISHEAIYQFVYDKEHQDLIVYLARAYRKRRLRGHSSKHKSSHIPSRTSIEKRPKYIERRIQHGHWETDTVVSRKSKRSLAVVLERSSRLVQISKIAAKTSMRFSAAINRRLKCYPQHVLRTITYDNGSENVEHQKVNKLLGTKSFFCNPYHSWEKGSVEYAVGLIRRFLPKKTDFAMISYQKVKRIEHMLNDRPRKCLQFKTPHEVFYSKVALAG